MFLLNLKYLVSVYRMEAIPMLDEKRSKAKQKACSDFRRFLEQFHQIAPLVTVGARTHPRQRQSHKAPVGARRETRANSPAAE
jgi:hypothetical protein